MTEHALADVERRIDEARERLAQATGGAALCRIGADAGEGRLAVKRAEGAAAALADLRQALRRGADPVEARGEVLATWEADRDAHRARGSAPEWVAYCEGGVAALADVPTSPGP